MIEIGKKVDRTSKKIYNWRKKHKIKANGKKEKLSDDKIEKINSYNKQGFSITEIAKKSIVVRDLYIIGLIRNDLKKLLTDIFKSK